MKPLALVAAFTVSLAVSLTLLLSPLVASPTAYAEDIFRIQIGRDYNRYSNEEMRRRIWELERAVSQLQMRVFALELQGSRPPVETKQWTCLLQSFGKTHTASASSRTAALAMVLKRCSDATNAVHCSESDAKCSNE